MPTVTVNDQTLYYELIGAPEAPPILLIHGWLQVGRDLAALAQALAAEGYRVILPDVSGYGRSVPPFRRFPPDFYQRDAADMAGLLRALQIDSAHVMGFSDGGEIALLLGCDHSALCRSVVAWAAVGAYSPALSEYVRSMPSAPITPAVRARHPGQPVERWEDEWREAFAAIVANGGDISLSRAHQIACPLLLMVGDGDKLNPAEDSRRFVEAATHPRCTPKRFVCFENTGHAIHEERVDAFLAEVRAFLSACP
ncbi:MAG: alpha/beta hydrolase [Anaerolineae bacterium]|nr:alpha/beta hydrolase [Anaerolineae bacterium]MDW8297842.1 alpha/beta hydrolase [Anaerolineae bacterium]